MHADPFPIEAVRAQFPALRRDEAGPPRAYFDGPGGTQVCAPAIARMVAHLQGGTANAGGAFATSAETDALSAQARAAVADLLGAEPDEIAFGPNMTSLTFAVSRALARRWEAGDELVVTRLDHDANVAPWLEVARERGMTVRWLDFEPSDGRWRLDELPGLLNARTRLVALGAASNALGTLTPVAEAAALVRAAGLALVYVDAVQSVPHVVTDVRALGCHFLACSPYKFFGPHQGVLWADRAVVEDVEAFKVRPASTAGAKRFETGTPSFESQAAVLGVVEYLEGLGERVGAEGNSRRARLVAALEASAAYEERLSERLLAGFQRLPKLRLWGPPGAKERVPTFSFTIEGWEPRAVVERLGEANINAWSGHFYAVETIKRLGLEAQGGLIRVGLCHYNTAEEIDRLLEALAEVAG